MRWVSAARRHGSRRSSGPAPGAVGRALRRRPPAMPIGVLEGNVAGVGIWSCRAWLVSRAEARLPHRACAIPMTRRHGRAGGVLCSVGLRALPPGVTARTRPRPSRPELLQVPAPCSASATGEVRAAALACAPRRGGAPSASPGRPPPREAARQASARQIVPRAGRAPAVLAILPRCEQAAGLRCTRPQGHRRSVPRPRASGERQQQRRRPPRAGGRLMSAPSLGGSRRLRRIVAELRGGALAAIRRLASALGIPGRGGGGARGGAPRRGARRRAGAALPSAQQDSGCGRGAAIRPSRIGAKRIQRRPGWGPGLAVLSDRPARRRICSRIQRLPESSGAAARRHSCRDELILAAIGQGVARPAEVARLVGLPLPSPSSRRQGGASVRASHRRRARPGAALRACVPHLRAHRASPRSSRPDSIRRPAAARGDLGAVLAQSSTRRIIAGNHRTRVARQRGEEAVPVLFIRAARGAASSSSALPRPAQGHRGSPAPLAELAAGPEALESQRPRIKPIAALLRRLPRAETRRPARLLARHFIAPPFSVLRRAPAGRSPEAGGSGGACTLRGGPRRPTTSVLHAPCRGGFPRRRPVRGAGAGRASSTRSSARCSSAGSALLAAGSLTRSAAAPSAALSPPRSACALRPSRLPPGAGPRPRAAGRELALATHLAVALRRPRQAESARPFHAPLPARPRRKTGALVRRPARLGELGGGVRRGAPRPASSPRWRPSPAVVRRARARLGRSAMSSSRPPGPRPGAPPARRPPAAGVRSFLEPLASAALRAAGRFALRGPRPVPSAIVIAVKGRRRGRSSAAARSRCCSTGRRGRRLAARRCRPSERRDACSDSVGPSCRRLRPCGRRVVFRAPAPPRRFGEKVYARPLTPPVVRACVALSR